MYALLSKELWKLTALRLGEDRAASLGINLQVLRIKVLVLVAMMTATAISFVGVIGFIGLVAPHVARMLLGEDQTFLLTGRDVSLVRHSYPFLRYCPKLLSLEHCSQWGLLPRLLGCLSSFGLF